MRLQRCVSVSVGVLLAAVCLPLLSVLAVPGEGKAPPPNAPEIVGRSEEAERAIGSFRVPQGMQVRLFAAEPDLANPVAFFIDNQGKVYVCETFRQGKGVEDNRGHGHWLDDDLAAQTVEDRLAYIRKHLGERANDYTRHDDRIRLLEDTTGDGRADRATVFADRFNSIVEGTGAGVLVHRGNVYYTCIPNLWLLRDENGDGTADVRQSLSYGYGVRFAFRGHDMHGLVIGPDGKLYFSIGDRGLNVKQGDRHFVNPESGAVLRCNLDGSDLEMIHTGLRNPQELAFDDYGNLFTGDNNSDSGDRARWTLIVDGGDTGWRMEYQYLNDRGPFNRETIWHPYHEGQPAYIIPPIANFADGPSGLTFYPGTGLSDHFKDRFFLCDFRGTPGNSGVRTFRVKPKGAFFELIDSEETFWSALATDVDFGPDGAVYLSDWVDGWNGEGKGRIYKCVDPQQENSDVVQQVKRLLAEGFEHRQIDDLLPLLGHADRRVRQGAQFALVDKEAAKELIAVAGKNDLLLARLHAIWGLGMLARISSDAPSQMSPLVALLDDEEAEVRAQAAKVLGDHRFTAAVDPLIERLADDSARVQYFAAQSLGKLKSDKALPSLVACLAANADEDPALRHAGIMGLAGSADAEALADLATHEAASVRIAAVVALRRQKSPAISTFLNDSDPRVVVEAARAIHDLPIASELPKLAGLISRSSDDDALLRRVLNANYRLGGEAEALAIAEFAARNEAPKQMRIEALAMLESWDRPSPKDRVLGAWRPLEPRSLEPAIAALKRHLPGMLVGDDSIRAAAAQTAAKLDVKEIGPALAELLTDQNNLPDTRAEALTALVALKDPQAEDSLTTALSDDAAQVRAAARDALARLRPAEALPLLKEGALEGERVERQAAFATLATLTQPGTNAILSEALDQLLAGKMPADSRLDLLEAAAKRADNGIQAKLRRYESARPSDHPLSAYLETLEGGSAERGRKLFLEKTQLSCVRCHKVGDAGGEVGPPLDKIGREKTREYLLESIVLPSQQIAKGFDTAIVATDDGKIVSGVVREETESELRLITAEGKLLTIDKQSIEERNVGKSAMPEDLVKHLTPKELRDLVEFLASLKD
jgi:quinoprotein glucose dehydrogenase